MSNHRVTRFRSATVRSPRREWDPFDRIAVIFAAATAVPVNLFAVIPAMLAMNVTAVTTDVYLTWSLVCMSANLVVIRGSWKFAQRVIRPWLFDREQRNNEIVPHVDDRRRTRA